MFHALIAAALSFQSPNAYVLKAGGEFRLLLSDGKVVHRSQSGITAPKTYRVPGSKDIAVLWSEGGSTRYALLPRGEEVRALRSPTYTIRLRYAEFDPLVSIPAEPAALKTASKNDVFIVQFHTQPMESYRAAIQAAGGEVTYYLADNSYIVRMKAGAKDAVSALPFVRWVGAYSPAYKLDPALREAMDAGTLGKRRYNLQVYNYGLEDKVRLAALVKQVGGTPLDVTQWGYVMQADLTPDQLKKVLASNDVFWVDEHSDLEPDMDIVRQVSGANYLETVAGYRGEGVRGQVRDGGVLATHADFQSRPLIVRTNTSNNTHGTPCTGIVFGDGAANPAGRGVLPKAQGIFLAGLTNGSTRYTETQGILDLQGVFESNSTGGTLTGSYTTDSFGMDDILFRMNLIICQSMSNWGSNTQVRPQAWAKNIVSVGGIKHQNTLTKADDNWTSGGSIGPAADGRIKPDVSHFYDSVFSPYSSSTTAYTQFSGTSSATPITTGHFGLLFQMWADGAFFNTAPGNSVFQARPHWSLMKALMINSANQYTFSGATADLTRTHQGWGLADVKNAYDDRGKLFLVNQEKIDPFEAKTYRVYVPAGQPYLKATMVYKEPPGTTSSTRHRINDLTLKVTSPDGLTFYYGNNGLLANMWSTPGGAPNTVDPVENIMVQNPASGVWTVEVSAPEINQDARLETAELDADFSLVVNGVVSGLTPTSIGVRSSFVSQGGLAEISTSNNVRAILSPTATGARAGDGADVIVQGTVPPITPQDFRVRIEGSENYDGSGTVTLFNFQTGTYERAQSFVHSSTERAFEVSFTGNILPYVEQGSGTIRARIQYGGYENAATAGIQIDQIRFLINP